MVKKSTIKDIFRIGCFICIFIVAIVLLCWICNIKNPFASSFREYFTDSGNTFVLKGTWGLDDNQYWDSSKGNMVQWKDSTNRVNYTTFKTWTDVSGKCGVHVIDENGDLLVNESAYDDITVAITKEDDGVMDDISTFDDYVRDENSSSFTVTYTHRNGPVLSRTVYIINGTSDTSYIDLSSNNHIVKANWGSIPDVPSNMIDNVNLTNTVWDILLGESIISPDNNLSQIPQQQNVSYTHTFSDGVEKTDSRTINVISPIESSFIAFDGVTEDQRNWCENKVNLDKAFITYGCNKTDSDDILTPNEWSSLYDEDCPGRREVSLYDGNNFTEFDLYPRDANDSLDMLADPYTISQLQKYPDNLKANFGFHASDDNGDITIQDVSFNQPGKDRLTWTVPFGENSSTANTCNFNFSILPSNFDLTNGWAISESS